MMKKLLTFLSALVLGAAALQAQTPRAVLKAIYKADDKTQVEEKYTRTVRSNPENDPEMILMRAVYLNYIGAPVDAYYTYCKSRQTIETDQDIAKMLKSLQVRLPDIFSTIESASTREILRQDKVEAYNAYIDVAAQNSHPALDVLCTAREKRAYSDAVTARTVAACDTFLVNYPDAAAGHKSSMKTLRADLRYTEASQSTDEAFIEAFLEEYPSYAKNKSLKDYLADLRYARVSNSGSKEDMNWFCTTYPEHPGTATLRRTLSDLDYETLDRTSLEAVRAYLAEYPEATHAEELTRWVDYTSMMQEANLKTIFKYVSTYGYDSDYPAMVRAIASIHGAEILTPDISEVDMVRFRDAKGRVGYWDMEGNVAVAPRYGMLEDAYGHFRFDAVFAPEFVKGRGCAAVLQNGKVGTINRQGSVSVPIKGIRISIADDVVLMLTKEDNEWIDQYTSETYSYSGSLLGSDVYMLQPEEAPCARRAAIKGVKAGRLNSYANVSLGKEDYRHILTRDGIALLLEASANPGGMCAYTDKYITTGKGIVDASTWSIVGPDEYDGHEFIKEGRVLVNKNGQWGYLDENLEVAIPLTFSAAESFCGGAALVQDAEGYKLIDRGGASLFKAEEMEHLSPGARSEWDHYALYAFRSGTQWGVVDSGACVLLEPVDADNITLNFADGVVECTKSGKTKNYNILELLSKASK